MRKFDGFKSTVVLVVALFISAPAFGQGFGAGVTVQEIQEGGNTELNVINNSSDTVSPQPFNIVAFAIRSFNGGDNPSTTEPGWTAEALTAALWVQPMGGSGSTLSTWEAYTGETYTDAFPEDPAEVNAYVTTPGSPDIITPGSSLNGFFFQGTPTARQIGGLPETDQFLIVKGHGSGPIIGPIIENESETETGSVEVVPEPGSLNLCLLMAVCFGVSGTLVRLKLNQN
jgi:hypothetical protein